MFNPSFRELREKGGNRYTLALLISKRAREIVAGDEPLVETNSNRPVSIALEELFEDKITFSERPPEIFEEEYVELETDISSMESDDLIKREDEDEFSVKEVEYDGENDE
ncbi:MAG: DNA-directed RNA polymerase subunit omega [Tissierellia bacterium]|nr:DNA-directed RNA polymerase subunit omega [Tissierellia bacterium]